MITGDELRKFLYDRLDADQSVIVDEFYSLPSREWLFGELAQSFKQTLTNLGVAQYVPESNDCDKFSWLARSLALLSNSKTQKGHGVALGVFNYKRDSGGGHSINFAVCQDSAGGLELVFFEPQNQTEAIISKNEARNVQAYIV